MEDIIRGKLGNMHSIGIGVDYLSKRYYGVEVSTQHPAVIEYDNVFYIPHFDCLYDSGGNIIIESCCDYTEKGDILFKWSKPPTQVDISKYSFYKLDEHVIFGSSIYAEWGHFLTDDISRLWYYFTSGRDRKIFFSASSGLEKKWVLELLRLSGINQDHILKSKVPININSVTIPIPSFQFTTKIYKCHNIFFFNVVKYLRDCGNIQDTKDNYYLSRSRLPSTKRKVINEGEVEAFLVRHGYKVMFPEQLTVAQQIEIFNTTGNVLLCEGSAVHTSLFSYSDMKLGVLGPKPSNWRFYMIDKIKDYNSFYFKTNKKDNISSEKVNTSTQDQVVNMKLLQPFLREAGFID
ncbi:glycosyltransferase 61 family protein [Xanthobacter sp. V4C-4]|uniref:glycosyltransferase family 61 protein n=1 Tax=Xanthobacter cornucopiae TaxID=3119924 RepID=UPI00372BC03E